jgi:hypothetical protein
MILLLRGAGVAKKFSSGAEKMEKNDGQTEKNCWLQITQ